MLKDSNTEVCFKHGYAEALVSAAWRVDLLERRVAKDTDLIRSRNGQLVLWLEVEVRVCITSVQDWFNVSYCSDVLGVVCSLARRTPCCEQVLHADSADIPSTEFTAWFSS